MLDKTQIRTIYLVRDKKKNILLASIHHCNIKRDFNIQIRQGFFFSSLCKVHYLKERFEVVYALSVKIRIKTLFCHLLDPVYFFKITSNSFHPTHPYPTATRSGVFSLETWGRSAPLLPRHPSLIF